MDQFSRLLDTGKIPGEEADQDASLRPSTLNEFIGQKKITENLKVFIESARMRKKSLDHILLSGPPGLGKTTLAFIIAQELGVNLKATSAPIIDKAGDLASILTGLEENDVLFIDEIHRLSPAIEEILYPAMEDRSIDIIIGQGVGAKSIKLNLAPFTLVGATTRTGLLTSALRDRFGIPLRLNYYEPEELKTIALRTAGIMGIAMDDDAALEIAKRSRRTPRIVNRIVRRVADFSVVMKKERVDLEITRYALDRLDIDELGLDEMDRRILHSIIEKYSGGPVGLKTIAISVGEETDTLEDYYEPFLVQSGLLKRTPRGRMATMSAYRHLDIKFNSSLQEEQQALFEE
ncbi:MAG TPA: Holliday junction branch migration DNA helicase RuvB [Spirochaetota bacterium]|nr:Holliday junction branch migration DNA helicase RuvB [Spirochaetota bacterium]HPF07194.1 Holliday junction branch migration DNA helicase RuvB [Spirochaetota bacterium]HPJ43694.1 Holliday junction branch migration DNA helicase RuvB [Spirochaetota bacterium]HPR38701.1 Holliday junction branch migration DNA helicase RuvB [Spirochaetota bacterium]HRX48741.1 Holliday junction branch migration DNA helicase RuvB [Spirochaetota bacterium]